MKRLCRTILPALIALLLINAAWPCSAVAWTRTDTLRVASANDDVRLIGSDFSNTGTLYHGYLSGDGLASSAHRPMSLIPAGQTITSAYWVPSANSQAGTCTTRVFLQKSNNPSQITSSVDFNARIVADSLTTDSITIIGGITWVEGTRYPFEITALMQQVYNAGFCDSGEFVNLFWLGRNLATSTAYLSLYAYDQSATEAGFIVVTHETAAAEPNNRRRRAIIMQGAIIDDRFPIQCTWTSMP
ncbi:MAG: hypothetical protein IT585_10850 [candidate division Zixibacteria bacterium]|nr:hypothetical protein [candidate division Zixibacteria bacterium]